MSALFVMSTFADKCVNKGGEQCVMSNKGGHEYLRFATLVNTFRIMFALLGTVYNLCVDDCCHQAYDEAKSHSSYNL
jgi:hypothetical protein